MQTTGRTIATALRAFTLLAAMLASACTTSGRFVSDWGQITLAPGDTGTCSSNPCQVFFEMPPGDGTYTVTGTGFTIGDYPAGKTVNIGSFFESSAIKVDGAGVPNAYIYVPGTTSDVN
jgi:hypothetical protein